MKKIRYTVITVCIAVFVPLLASACTDRRNGNPVLPPETSPLSQYFVGYGVINALHARLGAETSATGPAAGHERMGTVVKIHERRLVRTGTRIDSWLLVEADSKGWVPEELVDVYINESQARTAAESMR